MSSPSNGPLSSVAGFLCSHVGPHVGLRFSTCGMEEVGSVATPGVGRANILGHLSLVA